MISRSADICRYLYDCWPTRKSKASSTNQACDAGNWPVLYNLVEQCMCQMMPAVHACSWLMMPHTGSAQNVGGTGCPIPRRNLVPRLLQTIEDFDMELLKLVQLSARTAATAFESAAGGVARPILSALKSIQHVIAEASRTSTAAAAEEVRQQRVLEDGPNSDKGQGTRVPSVKKKRKQHALRSRNSYVDAMLNDEEDGDEEGVDPQDTFADLEDWIVFKRGRNYGDSDGL